MKRTDYHHGNLRDHLIDAKHSLISTDGLEHFKVADACRHAGVSTAALIVPIDTDLQIERVTRNARR